jgi:hypothetical protein
VLNYTRKIRCWFERNMKRQQLLIIIILINFRIMEGGRIISRSDSHWKNTTTCSLKRMIWSLKVHIQSEYFDIQFSTSYITFDVNSSRLAVSIAFIYMQKNISHALCMPAPSLSFSLSLFFVFLYIFSQKNK